MTDIADSAIGKGLRASAWLLYCLIVFEILFMVSPFALYYYSVYALPLNWLQQSVYTGWLTLHILPHFTYTTSLLSNTLLLVAWPLILSGLMLFFMGFVQIYWAKLTGKANVEVGLYRYIRHPQYVALAIVGLGTSIYWSRFIVLIAYVTMLFLYYFLATHEERVCRVKFGDTYRDYQTRTGMFLPKAWLGWMPNINFIPQDSGKRVVAFALLYATLVGASVAFGWGFKHHLVNRMTLNSESDTVLVALAPTSPETLAQIQTILGNDDDYRAKRARYLPTQALGYVAPSSWTVPELGLLHPGGHRHSGMSALLHPSIHGNSLDFDKNRITVLLTEPVLIDSATRGKDTVLGTFGYIPKLKVELDMRKGTVLSVSEEPYESQWKGIPVPVY